MRKVRIVKKSQSFKRSVQSQSRQIISSIYSSDLNESLQFNSRDDNLWTTIPKNLKITAKEMTVTQHQPLKHLLPLLQHLSKGFYFDICSFIFFDHNSVLVAHQQGAISIKKDKNEKNRLRYWLSHIYFHRMRKSLAERLINSDTTDTRQIIHNTEEKQYMPPMLTGKNYLSSFVKTIKVSPQSFYSKRGVLECQPFCIGYFRNGAEQLFSFSQILSFIQYPFNLEEVSFLKILTTQKQETQRIKTEYSKASQTLYQRQKIEKLKRILKKQQRWLYIKNQIEEQKISKISNTQYNEYFELRLLQIISFLEVNQMAEVLQLNLEWIIDNHNNGKIYDCSKYRYATIASTCLPQDLISLFEQNRGKSLLDPKQIQKPFRVKKTRSQKKYNGGQKIRDIPRLNWKRPMQRSELFSEKMRSIRSTSNTSNFDTIKLNKSVIL